MNGFGSCIFVYLVIRKYLSIEFSPLIILGIPAFMAIAEFIIYVVKGEDVRHSSIDQVEQVIK